MAKRYKLVPEALFRRYMEASGQDGQDDHLEMRPKQILHTNLPDDAKILLYGDAARDFNVKQVRKRDMPILVKDDDKNTIDKVGIMSEDKMISHINNPKGVAIHLYLKSHGITYNANNEVVVNGQEIPGSLYPLMIRGLVDYRVGYQPGMMEVMQAIPGVPPEVSKAVTIKYMPKPSTSAATPTPVRSSSPSRKGFKKPSLKITRKMVKRPQTGNGYKWQQLF
jgi:hypothetical protein